MIGDITLEMTFDAGHRIVGHKGKCARLHGHTYRARISARGLVKTPGFVVDFGDIKDLVNQWDHRLLLWEEDRVRFGYDESPDMQKVGMPVWPDDDSDAESKIGIVRLPFNPTAENMVEYLALKIKDAFSLTQVQVELWETPNSCARAEA